MIISNIEIEYETTLQNKIWSIFWQSLFCLICNKFFPFFLQITFLKFRDSEKEREYIV